MQIIENQPERLILQNRSLLFGVVFALGAVLWVVVVIGTAIWGTLNVSRPPVSDMYMVELFGLGVMFVFGVVFSWLGAQTAITVLRGTTCTFDRTTEQVTVTTPERLHLRQDHHSIYGVSHAYAEHNDDLHTFALYLVLRSGERIPLGTCQEFEQDEVETIVKTVRAFLKGA
jgi:hypothetical protein